MISAAALVVRRVQRDRQVGPPLPARHRLDAGHHADGRDGDAARRDPLGQDVERRRDALEVEQRLAHPHEDQVEPLASACPRSARMASTWPTISPAVEVAARAPVAGDAEGAGQGAAGLARDAEGAAARGRGCRPPRWWRRRRAGAGTCRCRRATARRSAISGRPIAEALGEPRAQLLAAARSSPRSRRRRAVVERLVDLLDAERPVDHRRERSASRARAARAGRRRESDGQEVA